jgi:hypothetical protein
MASRVGCGREQSKWAFPRPSLRFAHARTPGLWVVTSGYSLTGQTYLGLCAIQVANGTAANAGSFAPLGYKTGKDAYPDDEQYAAASINLPAVMLGAGAVLLTSALAIL